jgi:hypothetical protein
VITNKIDIKKCPQKKQKYLHLFLKNVSREKQLEIPSFKEASLKWRSG